MKTEYSLRQIANGWISYSVLDPKEKEDSELFEYYDQLQMACQDRPDDACAIIFLISDDDLTEESTALLGSGPLEDILRFHQDFFWNEFDEITPSKGLLKALSFVWMHAIPEKSKCKISSILGN